MPFEVIHHIMSCMNLETLKSFSSTCSKLNYISNDWRLWKQFILVIPPNWKLASEALNHEKFKKMRVVHMPDPNMDIEDITDS